MDYSHEIFKKKKHILDDFRDNWFYSGMEGSTLKDLGG